MFRYISLSFESIDTLTFVAFYCDTGVASLSIHLFIVQFIKTTSIGILVNIDIISTYCVLSIYKIRGKYGVHICFSKIGFNCLLNYLIFLIIMFYLLKISITSSRLYVPLFLIIMFFFAQILHNFIPFICTLISHNHVLFAQNIHNLIPFICTLISHNHVLFAQNIHNLIPFICTLISHNHVLFAQNIHNLIPFICTLISHNHVLFAQNIHNLIPFICTIFLIIVFYLLKISIASLYAFKCTYSSHPFRFTQIEKTLCLRCYWNLLHSCYELYHSVSIVKLCWKISSCNWNVI